MKLVGDPGRIDRQLPAPYHLPTLPTNSSSVPLNNPRDEQPAGRLPLADSPEAKNRTTAFDRLGPEGEPVALEPAPRRRPLRFTHPSGSRPLDGYTIKRGIGIGGFGEVYFALSDAGKEVALKRIQRNLDIELRGVRQCLNLKHVNLIALWDIRTTHEGESWVVMEYVPGQSLRDILEQAPQGLPEEAVKRWFTSIAAGVSYLHDHGIVHRDLKPGNVFYDADEQVIKIGDYGLSKFISCSKRSGQTESVGTFHYMAPEIGKGVYGKEIDIYALGVMLYEMLSGQLPFDGESSQEIIMKHLTADPDLRVIPEPFREVLERALAKDPEWRYSDVSEFCADLPWQDVAASAREIVTRHNIGPFGAPLAGADAPTQRGQERNLPVRPVGAQAQTGNLDELVFLDRAATGSGQPEISFGPLQSHVESSTNPARGGQRTLLNQRQPLLRQTAGAAKVASGKGTKSEPIAAAMRGRMTEILGWWNNPELATPLKVFAAAAATIVLVLNSAWLIPLALVLALLYLLYYCVRSLFVPADHEVAPKLSKRDSRLRELWVARQWLGARPLNDRLMDLSGSLLVAAASGGLLSLFGLAVGQGGFSAPELESSALYAWLAVTSVVAAWGVLIASKCWEHGTGDFWIRRITQAGIGASVGVVSISLARLLGVRLMESVDAEVSAGPLAAGGLDDVLGYLIFFMLMFALPNWSALADPLRRTRLSLFQVGLCLVCAVFAASLQQIEPTWHGVLAAVAAISTQLAAPWLAPNQREHLVRERGFE
jgi:serine/threonine protein kinase